MRNGREMVGQNQLALGHEPNRARMKSHFIRTQPRRGSGTSPTKPKSKVQGAKARMKSHNRDVVRVSAEKFGERWGEICSFGFFIRSRLEAGFGVAGSENLTKSQVKVLTDSLPEAAVDFLNSDPMRQAYYYFKELEEPVWPAGIIDDLI